ncbi:EAL domain-containing protein [Luteimonas sp. RIT-PG2_3]
MSLTASTRGPWLPQLLRALLVSGCAMAGGLLGAVLCWQAVTSLAEQRLGAYSGLLLDRALDLDREVLLTIARFNGQPGQMCSDAEFEQLRETVYRTYYIKDIGRVRNGDLVCSASLFRVSTPRHVGVPDLRTADGRDLSLSQLQLLAHGSRAPTMGRGDTRVVLDPAAFRILPFPDAQVMVGYLGEGSGGYLSLYGTPMRLTPADLRAGTPFDRDGALFYPQCALDRGVCVASSQRKTSLLENQWPLMLVGTLLGAIAGTALGVSILLWQSRRQSMEARLQRAIANDALEVEYQPVVRIDDGAIVGAEALVRWRDRDGRMVPPARFIPIAEDNGSISRITTLVIRRVLRDFADLLVQPGEFRINVNISANDLDNSRFHLELAQALALSGVTADRLCIELTEHSTAAREVAISGTRRLHELGHRVYIDDFGTGYSSLAYLSELDVHALKIDRSFTSTIDTDGMKVTLVPQIIDLARTLHMQVVIEGVETQAQVDYLRAIGYPLFGQGWWFGRPMTAAAFRQRIADEAAGGQAQVS